MSVWLHNILKVCELCGWHTNYAESVSLFSKIELRNFVNCKRVSRYRPCHIDWCGVVLLLISLQRFPGSPDKLCGENNFMHKFLLICKRKILVHPTNHSTPDFLWSNCSLSLHQYSGCYFLQSLIVVSGIPVGSFLQLAATPWFVTHWLSVCIFDGVWLPSWKSAGWLQCAKNLYWKSVLYKM